MGHYESALRDSRGHIVYCGHKDCGRPAVRIVSYESPRHAQFHGQTHDCCAVHSRPPKPEDKES